ncbi:hypothetical protein GW813_00190 [bacterium]|nr:hypothetical protein [bacterium]
MLSVEGDVPTGLHHSLVTLFGSSEDVPLAVFEVTLRAWHRAPPGSPHYALVIGIDGLRPDAIAPAHTPNVDWLVTHVGGTLSART